MLQMLCFLFLADPLPLEINLSDYGLYGHTADLAVAPDGSIAITDAREHRFLLLRPTDSGIPEHRWRHQWCGRPGDGPGEFHRIGAIAWHHAEQSWWVVDYRGRCNTWGADGTFQRMLQLGSTWFSYLGMTQNGRFFTGHFNTFNKLERVHRGEVNFMDGSGAPEESLYRFDLPPTAKPNLGTPERPRFLIVPWMPTPHLAVGKDFAVIWQPDTSRLRIYNTKGKEKGEPIPVSLPQVPLTEPVIQKAFGRRYEALHGRFKLPEWMPRVRALNVSAKNEIWVFGYGLNHSVPFRILDTKGRTLGKGSMWNIPRIIGTDRYYTLEENEDGDLIIEIMPLTAG